MQKDIIEEKNNDEIKKIVYTLPEVEQKSVHTIAYLNFLESPILSPMAKIVWEHLSARKGTNGYVWFSKDKATNTLGFSRNTYDKYIKELESVGAIIQLRRYLRSNGGRDTNIIIVCEWNQFTCTFVVPENIDAIRKSINEKFNTTYIIEDNISKEEQNGEKQLPSQDLGLPPSQNLSTPPSNNCDTPKVQDLGLPPSQDLGLPSSNNCDAPSQNLRGNNSNSNNINFNDSKEENKSNSENPSSDNLINKFSELKDNVIKLIKEQITEVGYNTWYRDTLGKSYLVADEIVIPCPNNFTKKIVEARHIETISHYFEQLLGKKPKLKCISPNE